MSNHFYAQINRGHPRKTGGYSGRNIVKRNNKDEDNSPKTLTDKNEEFIVEKSQILIQNIEIKIARL